MLKFQLRRTLPSRLVEQIAAETRPSGRVQKNELQKELEQINRNSDLDLFLARHRSTKSFVNQLVPLLASDRFQDNIQHRDAEVAEVAQSKLKSGLN